MMHTVVPQVLLAQYKVYVLYLLWHCVAAHMGSVLGSTMLHAVLSAAQPMQPLHSPAPHWLLTS